MGLLLSLIIIFVFLYDVDDFILEASDLTLELLTGLSELSDVCLHLIFLLLGHECFPHSIGY